MGMEAGRCGDQGSCDTRDLCRTPSPSHFTFLVNSRFQFFWLILLLRISVVRVACLCCSSLIFLYSFEQCFILTVGDENFVLSPPGLGAHLCMLECSLTLCPCLSVCPCLSLTFPILFPVLFYYTDCVSDWHSLFVLRLHKHYPQLNQAAYTPVFLFGGTTSYRVLYFQFNFCAPLI